MPNNAIPNLNTCNRSYSASLKQREFLRRSILKGPIHQVILNGEDVPKKIHHEFLGSLLPFAGFDRNLVSPIQVVGVTDNLLIVHKSFTVIAILTVVNCEQLLKELQRIVEIFEVDVNLYSRYVKAIDREIGLIKKWRQRDNRIRSQLKG